MPERRAADDLPGSGLSEKRMLKLIVAQDMQNLESRQGKAPAMPSSPPSIYGKFDTFIHQSYD